MRHFDRKREKDAADWVARRTRGLDSAEESAFEEWKADPTNAAAFAEVQRSWDDFDRVRSSPAESRLRQELIEYRRTRGRTSRFPLTTLWISGTVAAAIVLIAGLMWTRSFRTKSLHVESASTDIGGRRTLTLPDGTNVQLNTSTFVRVQYGDSARQAILTKGEALFTVAKNPSRPFIVTAGGLNIRAVGTAFNVRLRPDSVEILVTEGSVALGERWTIDPTTAQRSETLPQGTSVRQLKAGEKATIPLGRIEPGVVAPGSFAVSSLTPTEIERALAWRDRMLVFESATLDEIVGEFNRYSREKLAVDAAVKDRRFGGKFQAADPSTFFLILKENYGIVVDRNGGENVLRPASNPHP